MKKIIERKNPQCSICGRKMHVVIYSDHSYRGGHHFGKIPLYRKSELEKMRRGGTHKSKISKDWIVDVCNYDPKPYAYKDYWECPACYWKGPAVAKLQTNVRARKR